MKKKEPEPANGTPASTEPKVLPLKEELEWYDAVKPIADAVQAAQEWQRQNPST